MRHGSFCHRCGGSLAGTEQTEVLIPGSTRIWPCAVCADCGWRNFRAGVSLPVQLSAAASLGPSQRALVGRILAGKASVDSLQALRCDVLDRVCFHVDARPPQALGWLFSILANLDELDSGINANGFYPLALQQVYLLLLRRGPLSAFSADDFSSLGTFWKKGWLPLLATCRVLGEAIRECRLGGDLLVEHGQVLVRLSDKAQWIQERNANVVPGPTRTTAHVDAVISEHLVCEAERVAYGYSVADVMEAVATPAGVAQFARVIRDGDLMILDLAGSTPSSHRSMLDAFTLDLATLRARSAPGFFRTGSSADRTLDQVMTEAMEIDWLGAFPFLAGVYGSDQPCRITSGYLIHRAKVEAALSTAYRLRNVSMAVKGTESARQVDALVREYHADAERKAARCFAAAGMDVVTALECVEGRPLPCGEIDVLASGRRADGRLVVAVCEVKNSDLGVAKDKAVEEAQDVVRKAGAQAGRKASWVHQEWRGLADVLNSSPKERPLVVPLVVLRETALAVDGVQPAVVAATELAEVIRQLLDDPVERWRPDVRRGMMTET